MPNWHQIVRDRLQLQSLRLSDTDSAIAELAAHLEESYENHRSRGLTEANALAETLQELENCDVLAKAIRRRNSEEGLMNYRTRTLWIPAMVSLLGASVAMTSLQFAGLRAQVVRTGSVEMFFYWPWLVILPLCGALGAYLSRRAGASVLTRLIGVLAPVLWPPGNLHRHGTDRSGSERSWPAPLLRLWRHGMGGGSRTRAPARSSPIPARSKPADNSERSLRSEAVESEVQRLR
jgi:hypothetical protein